MPTPVHTTDPVESEAWKNRFISLISNFEHTISFTNELNNSISTKTIAPTPLSDPLLLVNNILAQYTKRDLVAARHHYNNAHLIEFWKWYNVKLNEMINSGIIDNDFPVFSVSKGLLPGKNTINKLNIDFFSNFSYQKDPKDYFSYNYSKIDGDIKTDIYNNNSYDQMLGQLFLLRIITNAGTTFFYKMFISQERNSSSSTWDDYRIHEFLDRYLYKSPDGQPCSAGFESIFFSNNMNELNVYLHYFLDHKYEPKLSEISDFLDRQRKYYLSLATKISVEENAFLNNGRKLLYYDPEKGVVVMPKLDVKSYKYIHNELVVKTGVIKMSGCPFAKSKGISRNAVIEVFSRFDGLMLKLIENWKIKHEARTI